MNREKLREFVLDTNAWRNLAICFKDNIAEYSASMYNWLLWNKITCLFNPYVAMELIQHLLPSEKNNIKRNCFDALCIMQKACIDKSGNTTIQFFFEQELCDYFFGEKEYYKESLEYLPALMNKLTENRDIKNCNKHIGDIEKAKNELHEIKKEIKSNIEEYFIDATGSANWSDKPKQIQLNKELKLQYRIGKSLYKRACTYMSKQYKEEDAERKGKDFCVHYPAFVAFEKEFFGSFSNKPPIKNRLDDILHERYNTIIDLMIVFPVFKVASGVTLVTREIRLRKYSDRSSAQYFENSVIKDLWDFLLQDLRRDENTITNWKSIIEDELKKLAP
jgi:hypothetical protein